MSELKYFIVHKPVGVLSSKGLDPKTTNIVFDKDHPKYGSKLGGDARLTIFDIALSSGFPSNYGLVGRLDAETSGIMLMTNDSLFESALRNPTSTSYTECPFKVKVYRVVCMAQKKTFMSGLLSAEELRELENDLMEPLSFRRNNITYNTDRCQLRILKQFQDEEQSKGRQDLGWCIQFEISLQEGKHHQIRRIAQRSFLTVLKLTRTRIAHVLDIESIPVPGQCRWLQHEEVCEIRLGLGFCSNGEPTCLSTNGAHQRIGK